MTGEDFEAAAVGETGPEAGPGMISTIGIVGEGGVGVNVGEKAGVTGESGGQGGGAGLGAERDLLGGEAMEETGEMLGGQGEGVIIIIFLQPGGGDGEGE